LASADSAVPVSPPPAGAVSIAYVESSAIRVRGLASGRSYEFSGASRVQHVDPRDVSALLSTRMFRRA